MTPYRTLVVDDERPARAKVVRLLGEDAAFACVGEAVDGLDALEKIETHRPDLVILDVQMPGIDGFEVLEASDTERRLAVIFTTAHEQHALRAFGAHAIDYLLKPFDGERFHRALAKVRVMLAGRGNDLQTSEGATPPPTPRSRIVVKTDAGAWTTIQSEAIVRVSAANKHVCIDTREGKYRVRRTLREVAMLLDPQRFVRVHRGEIVNVEAVVRLESWTHGDGILVLANGSSVVLSRTHRAVFRARFDGET
jgi:two-component system, LytTR family, response regulator